MRHYDIDLILSAYIECELWSGTVIDGEDTIVAADSLDAEVHLDALASARADIEQFLTDEVKDICERHGIDDEQIGHDFSLTRNRHGAGFWDRGHGYDGQRLTTLAHEYGETCWYLDGDTLRTD